MRVFPMRVSPFFSLHNIPQRDSPPRSVQTRRRNPAHGRRSSSRPPWTGDGTGLAVHDWRGTAAMWRRRAQTLPLVDWGGADGGTQMTLTAKRLLHRLFVPP